MKLRANDAFTYMGLLDDMAVRYPWRFPVDDKTLDYLLTVELINGKPVLLNDGYLVNNEFVRKAIINRDGLLWELVRGGFVRVMSRGGDDFGLHELPHRMAPQIPTFAAAVASELPGTNWRELERALKELDMQLRSAQDLLPWPSLDAGSGFLALVENLRSRGVTPHVLGIGRSVGKHALASLLDEVSGLLAADTRAARTVWERTVLKYANDRRHTNKPQQFVSALMNLANEMYHYNMGILLTADLGANVSVQTQTSAAFDDLLVPPSLKFLLHEVPSIPKLHVPLAITQVDPLRLATLVRPGSKIFDARERWIRLRSDWDQAAPAQRQTIAPELKDAGDEYAKRLSEFVGRHVKFKETEELVEYVVGDLLKYGAGAAAGVALAAAGAPAAAAIAGTALLGYAVTRARKKYVGNVMQKFRVHAVEKTLKLPPSLVAMSEKAMRIINRRQVPSTIQITPSVATAMAPRLRRFRRES